MLFIILINLLSGPGIYLYSQGGDSTVRDRIIWTKKSLLKTFSILPFYEYKPKIDPSETTLILKNELDVCSKIVDDHIQFKSMAVQNRRVERGTGTIKYIKLLKWRERYDPIENKISDINYIRGLTLRYETWSPEWDKKANLARADLSLDEIDLLRFEAKRISKKLKYAMIKFL